MIRGVSTVRGPGRPRSAEARRAILDAALALASSRPYPELTIDAIARQAGVSRQTIYRWWRTPADVLLEALLDRGRDIQVQDTGDIDADVAEFMRRSFAALRGRIGRVQRSMMAAAQGDDALRERYRSEFVEQRRAVLIDALRRAQEAGRLPPGAPLELAADVAFGVMWYRLLVGHAALTDRAAREVAAAALGVARGS
jgi:AcrR family transcriptional regulator